LKFIFFILFLTYGCGQDYQYYFFKAPIYQITSEQYLNLPTNYFSEEKLKRATNHFTPFSLHYIEMPFDIVLGINHSEYSMIEIINSKIGNKNIWFTLESLKNGTQYIGLPNESEHIKTLKEFAKVLGAQTYESGLSVRQNSEKTIVNFNQFNFITRQSSLISFELIHPKGALTQKDGLFMPTYKNKNYERNSNAMNHSADKFIAIIDIHRALTPIHSKQLTFIDRSFPKLSFKKIIGSPVRTIISQNVLAIGPANKKNINNLPYYYKNSNDNLVMIRLEEKKEKKVTIKIGKPHRQDSEKNNTNSKDFTIEFHQDGQDLLMYTGSIKKKTSGEINQYELSHRPLSKDFFIKNNIQIPWFRDRQLKTITKGNDVISSTILNTVNLY